MRNFSKYHYLLSFILPTLTLASFLLGSWFIYLPLLHIVLFPLLDVFLGRSRKQAIGNKSFFKSILYSHVILQCVLVLVFLFTVQKLAAFSIPWLAVVFTMGMSALISAIAVGHELIHSNFADRWLGILMLLSTNYAHFGIEHLRAHHAYVGTHADPATARKNESLPAFYLRTILQQYIQVVRLSIHDTKVRRIFLLYTFMQVIFWAGIIVSFGFAVFGAWFLASCITIFGLEFANYIRHWGLERGPGETITPLHSWQSDAVWSRGVFLDLPVHSDHHISGKSYQALQFFDTNRYLPSGYYATFWIAVFPPIWKKLMLAKIEGLG